ncbi:Tripartite motif-containing protein 16 [Bagarius yarrelli]|uniref:Tripartite motif-containing protein 16 n=1 Tax=Bagarius yarrelli TaxID=175774 RepID=A0A556TW26_BAGYA|nr:Tripartite motif-containing protein 16 [Bagarius yarrelli]
MEHVKKVWPEPTDGLTPDKETIKCDVCEEGRELSAVKTCVTCLSNFCSVHVTPHINSQMLAKHCLCTPVSNIKDLLCKKHNKVHELFCMNHGTAICWQCTAKHRKCNTRLLEDMRMEWKAAIEPVKAEAQHRKDATNELLAALDAMSEGIMDAAEKMITDVQLCFEALINTITLAQNRDISFIEEEKIGALQKIEQQEKRLNNHLLSISLVMDTLDEFRNNQSYFNFLLPLPSLPREVGQLQDVVLNGQAVERMILDLQKLNSSMETQLSDMLHRREELQDEGKAFYLTSDDFKVVSGHSNRRGNLLKYSSEVNFDPVTASASVFHSKDGLTATVEHSGLQTWRDYQVNSEMGFRVLCSQYFSSGQHYWEVQPPLDKYCNWAVGVTYKNSQNLYQSLGQDSKSWCVRWQNKQHNKDSDKMTTNVKGPKGWDIMLPKSLSKEGAVKLSVADQESNNFKLESYPEKKNQESLLNDEHKPEENQPLAENVAEEARELTDDKNIPKQSDTGFFALHNKEMSLISQNPPGKIGVFLDHDRGWLSFFSVSDFKVQLCCRFQALFSAPLCPAVWLRDPESSMTISNNPKTTTQ